MTVDIYERDQLSDASKYLFRKCFESILEKKKKKNYLKKLLDRFSNLLDTYIHMKVIKKICIINKIIMFRNSTNASNILI